MRTFDEFNFYPLILFFVILKIDKRNRSAAETSLLNVSTAIVPSVTTGVRESTACFGAEAQESIRGKKRNSNSLDFITSPHCWLFFIAFSNNADIKS